MIMLLYLQQWRECLLLICNFFLGQKNISVAVYTVCLTLEHTLVYRVALSPSATLCDFKPAFKPPLSYIVHYVLPIW